MKKLASYGFNSFAAGSLFILLFSACEMLNLPMLETLEVTEIGSETAVCGGDITFEGVSAVIERGVVWGTEDNPGISGSKTSDGTGTGSFTSTITNLQPDTEYFIRAYATNEAGTAYGNIRSFTTLARSATDDPDR
jgi:hypothetical protein